jgi:hypothetical protein
MRRKHSKTLKSKTLYKYSKARLINLVKKLTLKINTKKKHRMYGG